jgi:hypothetical protein
MNGLMAIFSGIIAYLLKDRFGYVAPFMAAIVFLCMAGAIIQISWPENYGNVSCFNFVLILAYLLQEIKR